MLSSVTVLTLALKAFHYASQKPCWLKAKEDPGSLPEEACCFEWNEGVFKVKGQQKLDIL